MHGPVHAHVHFVGPRDGPGRFTHLSSRSPSSPCKWTCHSRLTEEGAEPQRGRATGLRCPRCGEGEVGLEPRQSSPKSAFYPPWAAGSCLCQSSWTCLRSQPRSGRVTEFLPCGRLRGGHATLPQTRSWGAGCRCDPRPLRVQAWLFPFPGLHVALGLGACHGILGGQPAPPPQSGSSSSTKLAELGVCPSTAVATSPASAERAVGCDAAEPHRGLPAFGDLGLDVKEATGSSAP